MVSGLTVVRFDGVAEILLVVDQTNLCVVKGSRIGDERCYRGVSALHVLRPQRLHAS
jgi:hypothetical protein